MNKKILRKLTLSAVTLGVAALSVTTSTFAWFTTNGSASASEVKGTVKSSDSNMLIKTIKAWDGQSYTNDESSTVTASGSNVWDSFSNSITLRSQTAVSLQPVTWSTESSWVNTSGSSQNSSRTGFHKAGADHKFNQEANDKDVLHYQVVFAITDLDSTGKKVTATFSGFTTSGDGKQYLLVNAYADSVTDPAVAGKTIQVSLLDVLSLRVESKILSSGLDTYGIKDTTNNLVTSLVDKSGDGKNYRYKAESSDLTNATTNDTPATLTGNAIDYYNNVYGLDDNNGKTKIAKPTDNNGGYVENTYFGDTNTTGIDLFSIKGTTGLTTAYVLTDFYFYIDGWDNQCFNCVGGLSLTGGKIDFALANNA